MIKKYFVLIAIVLFSLSAMAQTTSLTVSFIQDKLAVQNATAELYRLPDSLLISTKTMKGTIVFDVQQNRNYFLKVTAVNIQDIMRLVKISTQPVGIALDPKFKTNDLQNVTVTARKPLVKQEDDKTIVDAEVLANSSTNAYEVLEKTPGAVVDQDGNVYLNSATPATIFVNGREVKLSAADLASLLKSLPANSVSKIEILRNPSAKYDAASSGGIVNIVLKKGIKLGTSGSVNAAHFQGKYGTTSLGMNLNKSINKITSYFSYQFTKRNNLEDLSSLRYLNADTVLSQHSYTKYPGQNHYAGAGIDYAVNDKLTIGYDVRLSTNHNTSYAENANAFSSISSQVVTGRNNSVTSNNGNSVYLGNNASMKYKIDSAGSEFSASVDYNLYRNNNDQLYTNSYLLPQQPTRSGDGDISGRKNIFVAQADLVYKLKSSYTLEAGGKFTHSSSRNTATYFVEEGNSGKLLDSFQSNKFKYKESISSVYLQLAKTFYGFTLKPGLRMETTDINGQQLFPKDTSLRIHRTDFFPYVYLRHKLVKLFGFTLMGNAIYRRSISRPYYEALNPYPKYIDQYLYEVGNPKLRPQFTTNYEFNIMADDFPVFSIGRNDIKDIFTQVTYTDPNDSARIAYRTFDNLGRNKETYLRFVGGIPPGGKYFFYAGAQHNFSNYSGIYNNRPLEYKYGSWIFFMFHNYKASPTLNITLNGFMRLRGLQNFYELKSFGALNLTINKAVLKKKMNVILSANDILKTNKVDFTIRQAGITATGSRINDTRRIGLTLRYNFGIKPKEETKTSFDAPSENTN